MSEHSLRFSEWLLNTFFVPAPFLASSYMLPHAILATLIPT